MAGPRIDVLDADQVERSTLIEALVAQGYEAPGPGDGAPPDAVLVAAGRGAPVAAARRRWPEAALVAILESASGGEAAGALRDGADGFLLAPVEGARAAAALTRALETCDLRREAARLRAGLRQGLRLVGSSPALLAAQEVARRAAPTKATVLLAGECGTGRDLLAQVIHEASPRRDRPLVRAHCAGPSPELLAAEIFGAAAGSPVPPLWGRAGCAGSAAGGTLVLSEVAALPPSLQVRFLRLLQDGEVELPEGGTARADLRVVATTARDLAEEVRRGRFREDLYYRLGVVSVTLPPLRERKGDIPALVEHFLAAASLRRGDAPGGISPGALSALYGHDWPGNVRELERAVAEASLAAGGRTIGAGHLSPVLLGGPEEAGSALAPGAALADIEREAILRTLESAGGSTARAAVILGISVRKIQYRLREYRGGANPRRGGTAPALGAA